MARAKKKVARKAAKSAPKKPVNSLPREVRVSRQVEVLKVVVETPLNLKLTATVSDYGLTDLDVSNVIKDKGIYICTSCAMNLEAVANLADEEFEDLVLAVRGLREENRKNQLLLKAKK